MIITNIIKSLFTKRPMPLYKSHIIFSAGAYAILKTKWSILDGQWCYFIEQIRDCPDQGEVYKLTEESISKVDKSFNNTLNNSPNVFFEQYTRCIDSLERPDFHPERYLGKHIQIVYERAMATGNPILVMAALLHDICKCDKTFLEDCNQDKTIEIDGCRHIYWSNPTHAEQAADFIKENEDILFWILKFTPDINAVSQVVKYHMKFKSFLAGEKGEEGGMKLLKRDRLEEKLGSEIITLLREFNVLDKMI